MFKKYVRSTVLALLLLAMITPESMARAEDTQDSKICINGTEISCVDDVFILDGTTYVSMTDMMYLFLFGDIVYKADSNTLYLGADLDRLQNFNGLAENGEIRVILLGIEVGLTDAAGTPVFPFFKDDELYIPLRGTAEQMGYEVEWKPEEYGIYVEGNIWNNTRYYYFYGYPHALSRGDITLEVGDSYTMEIRSDIDGRDNAVWCSTDESIATMDENGTVTVNSEGVCNIIATFGEYTATRYASRCTVRGCNF